MHKTIIISGDCIQSGIFYKEIYTKLLYQKYHRNICIMSVVLICWQKYDPCHDVILQYHSDFCYFSCFLFIDRFPTTEITACRGIKKCFTVCTICGYQTPSLKRHARLHHLPWYICIQPLHVATALNLRESRAPSNGFTVIAATGASLGTLCYRPGSS